MVNGKMITHLIFKTISLLLRDLLFNQIYPRLVENSVARGVFLESLEPYILSERIGCLTAPVMRDLLSYFQENGMMDSVEGCLVHMDITNLDIQQVCMSKRFIAAALHHLYCLSQHMSTECL